LYTVSLLFSSGLYGSLKLFEGSALGPSLSELLDGWMDGGDCLDVERVCRQKKKSHLCLCALTKMKTVSCFVFSCFYFYFFSPKWVWVIERGKPSKSNKFGDIVPFGHEAPGPF